MYIPTLLPLLSTLTEKIFNSAATPPTQFPGHVLYTLNDGNQIPSPFFGVGSVLKGSNVTENALLSFKTGYRALDESAIYFNEDTAGLAIAASGIAREALYITTKFDALHGQDVEAEISSSLEKLGVSYVDLYLIHAPVFVKDPLDVWRKMEALVEQGFTRSIGVSNYDATQLSELLSIARIKPAVNQIRYHAYNAQSHQPLLDLAKKEGILIEAYSSLTPITSAPGGPADSIVEKVAKRLSKATGKIITPGQATLGWLCSKGIVAVTTSSKEERLKEQLVPFEKDFPAWTEKEIREYEAFPGWNETI
ncbi:NADP-dependent oxidoreductase domain-containing protein [Mrakia frigida]|uniref:NADP-dependent oxidoreductase domain-containing protein n=1 Tax=Mrakia frigida TaxID=29902 RepID=UPI003FCC1EFC